MPAPVTTSPRSRCGPWPPASSAPRLYYIITDKSQPWKEPSRWIRVWEGGLGIPGGLLAGVFVGIWMAKRRGLSIPAVLDAAAPAIPLAQAIGRWGNWFNQELFGRPTTLPWGLQIDDAHLPPGYASGTLFHPTFLYESLWNLALCGLLLLIDKKMRLRPGRLMADLCGRLLARAILDRGPAHRPGQQRRRLAPEPVGVGHDVRAVGGVPRHRRVASPSRRATDESPTTDETERLR